MNRLTIKDKYLTARGHVQDYISGNLSELEFKRIISEIMELPLPKSKEQHQIETIFKGRDDECKGDPNICDCEKCLKIKGEW